jgi:protein-S-isoprenylcysteine O-methyltransferase Ste14
MNSIDYSQIFIISMLWIGFFLIHSFTASLTLKYWVARHLSTLMPLYRIVFNIFSGILLIPVIFLSYTWRGEPLWEWSPVVSWGMAIIAVVTILAFIFSIRYYDMAEFMGMRQWRERNASAEDQEKFVIGDFHRFVRHPWYAMGIVLVWCREHDPIMLTNAIMITSYFIIGSRFEERKLIKYHGEIYRRYREKVPGLLPRPWRYLTRAEAKQLLDDR